MSTPLDLDAIRSRANAADASWLPRWVPFDLRCLLSEVVLLRGLVKKQSEEAAQHAAQHAGEISTQKRRVSEARDTAHALAMENTALRAKVEELAASSLSPVVAWLRIDAARTPPGPVSPVRRVEQAYATRLANSIERGEHRGEEGA